MTVAEISGWTGISSWEQSSGSVAAGKGLDWLQSHGGQGQPLTWHKKKLSLEAYVQKLF